MFSTALTGEALAASCEDELNIQRAYLRSLQDIPHSDNTQERISGIREKIRDLQQKLAEARRTVQQSGNNDRTRTSPSFPTPSNTNGNSVDPFSAYGPLSQYLEAPQPAGPASGNLRRPGAMAFSWGSPDRQNRGQATALRHIARSSPMPTSNGANQAGSGSRPGSALGKRPLDNISADVDTLDQGNKSRRTTPSPGLPNLLSSSPGFFQGSLESDSETTNVIDLTGDDDEQIATLEQQRIDLDRQRRLAQDARDRTLAFRDVTSPGQVMGGFPNAGAYSQQTPRQDAEWPQLAPNHYHNQHHVPGSFPDPDTRYPVGAPVASGFNPWSGGISSGPSFNSPADAARQAALSRFDSRPMNSVSGTGMYGTSSGPSAQGYDRPGYVADGRPVTSQFQPPPSQMPTHFSGPSNHLGDIINRTNHYDFDRMLDHEGTSLGPSMSDLMEGLHEESRNSAEEIAQLLSNIRPDTEIATADRIPTPEGLACELYPYQQAALKWMSDMETGTNRGGILADDMGLGKTVSTLALMSSRRAPEDEEIKTNLIIGPVALIKQWEAEINLKVKPGHKLRVYLLHGKKSPYSELKTYDVVLTTFNSLAMELKRLEKHISQYRQISSYSPMEDTELAKKCPLLHPKHRFYRVILDEAQCVKNSTTQSSKAVDMLRAEYRWCLTGTPMMNNTHELYALIRFLKIKPYCDLPKFKAAFSSLNPKGARPSEYQIDGAMKKMRVLLKAIMLRRMKASEFDGKPIVTLPEKTVNKELVRFNEDELNWYKGIEDKNQVQFNKYLRAGTVSRNYSDILVMLLKMRQACCHPHLDLDFEYQAMSDDAMIGFAKELGPDVVARLKATDGFECPICFDVALDPTLTIPCGHDLCSGCFARLTEDALQNAVRGEQDEATARVKCPQCRTPVDPKKITNWSAFKKVHMPETVVEDEAEPEAEGEDAAEDSDSSDSDFDSDLDSEADDRQGNHMAKKAVKSKSMVNDVQPHMLKTLRKEAAKNKESHDRYMKYLKKHWVDSTKLAKLTDLLQEIKETGEKTIVFSQWTSLLDLIEIPVRYRLKIKYCRYDGAMSPTQRNESVRRFVNEEPYKIMLCSLRAGNAGLNLTAASHVIIMDPFWNPYIEMQAIDRAHRIGQQRPVQVHRILVEETIEDRIMKLQDTKRDMIEAALDETENKNIGRLGVRELAFLFGV